MIGLDPEKCIKWCHEPAGHTDEHRHYLGEIMLRHSGNITSLSVTVEAPINGRSKPYLVITVATKEQAHYNNAKLTWNEVNGLIKMLMAARKRWAR